MPDQTAIFPDLKMVAIKVLIDAGVCGGRVFSSLPNDAGTSPHQYPLIIVHRLGGLPQNERWIDRANLQIEAWGSNQADCFDSWAAARKALLDAAGTTVSSCVISNVRTTLGPQDLPDPVTSRDRIIAGIAIYGHPVS